MRVREPGQVRKEAALSGAGYVPRASLTRANCGENARRPLSKRARTVIFSSAGYSLACAGEARLPGLRAGSE